MVSICVDLAKVNRLIAHFKRAKKQKPVETKDSGEKKHMRSLNSLVREEWSTCGVALLDVLMSINMCEDMRTVRVSMKPTLCSA